MTGLPPDVYIAVYAYAMPSTDTATHLPPPQPQNSKRNGQPQTGLLLHSPTLSDNSKRLIFKAILSLQRYTAT